MNNLKLFSFLSVLFIIGCNDSNETNGIIISNSTEVVTSDIMETNFYYNLVTKSEVQSDEVWHISAQSKQVDFGGQSYGMPNIVLGNVYAQLSDSTFSEITVPPAQNSSWFQDNTIIEYGGENEIISYNMTTHTASIINEDHTFIVYEYIGHTSYKVQFLDYTSGIVSFQFSPL
jgi:hypothetical protein